MVRPALLKHRFLYRVESSLHVADLKLGENYDSIYQEHGKWIKSRWERTQQSIQKRVEEDGETKFVTKIVPAFYHKDNRDLQPEEIEDIQHQLHRMNDAIDYVLNNLSDDFCRNAMTYEAATRKHQLTKFRPDIEQFKSELHRAIGSEFNLDANLTIFRIVCSEVWAAYPEEHNDYLQLVLE